MGMKKRILTFLLTIATMLACIFGFSACGKVEFQLSFVVENSVYATVSTSGNEMISMPENPTKEGYTFDGWYWDENIWEQPFTANSLLDAPLSSDMKVYAKFNKNHTHEYTQTRTEPTCAEKGAIAYTCACGDSYTEEISATGVHTWNAGEETTAPSCTKGGVTTYTCTVCKTATKTEPIDKLRHEYSTEWSSNDTYHWHECVCGDKADEEKHAAGVPATATTPQTCTVCDYILQEETGILFNTLTVDGTDVYGKVSNDTAIFSFIGEITVKGDATYVVDVHISCNNPIESKTAELSVGDNTFYVLEKIGNNVKLYTVTIRRRPMYEVIFNTNGGTSVERQVVEEDSLISQPTTTRAGYTCTGWDYDFTTPITKNTEITASWSANTDTKYTVVYYLQNIDDDYYTPYETLELTGKTDTTAYGETDRYAHFTYNASKSTISGNIDGEGTRILSVYYTRNQYVISTARNNIKAGAVSAGDTYKYNQEISLTATTNDGYTWLGWYDGDTLVCDAEEFTFKAEKDITYTAMWSVNTDTKYTVVYYLQNIDDDHYTPYETLECKDETDTTAVAEIKAYAHFTYHESASTISGNIDGKGTLALSVYYTRNQYSLSIDDTSVGSITNAGTYKYGVEEFTSTATPSVGCDFLGWYHGEMLLSSALTYTFNSTQDVVARFTINADILPFEFISTENTITITGIRDKTVTEIVVPDFVSAITKGAFAGCRNLTEITLPFVGGTTRFGYIFGADSYSNNGYYVPSTLRKVKITSATSIGNYAFYNCSNLTSIELPDGVISIGDNAFNHCSSLTSIELPDSVASIGGKVFYNCSSLTSIIVGENNTAYCAIDGNLYTKDGRTLLQYAAGKTDTAFTIPDSVVDIGAYAFAWCDNLTSVLMGDGVINICEGAFYYSCGLTNIVLSANV